MKKKIILLLLFVGLIIPQIALSQKIFLKKGQIQNKIHKIHPIEKEFRLKYRKFPQPKRTVSKNFNKLLVLLIDFQEDSDPETTGNGKFIQDPESYPIPLGKPPHDKTFFSAQLEALRYYYLAVSMGHYNLEYDIFPNPDSLGNFKAYTLPQEMAYYNQINASPELMIARFEEYFQDAFLLADDDPEIDFSQYEHFMLIHAGSDWQHDVKNDTPSDLPSFFIQIGDGKEVYVDDGNTVISHTCNIPETITQDIEFLEVKNEIYNYGLINAVMAHEFGHSLGYVDLYNVNNFQPAVGYFDIMDSGGSGLLGIQYNEQGPVYFIEGGLPALPGAWTRLLVDEWREYFIEQEYYKTIDQLDLDNDIRIQPAETKPGIGFNDPYFVKIPLTDKEYLLLENRQVDADGDGGIAFKGYLPITPDGDDYRILLYPTSTITGEDAPNYEYDYLLPGWQDATGNSFGGGLLIWHIDENIIYENDNFANNTINTVHSRRGVKIIEADDLEDIGNPYSYFWLGTAYENYFKYMPTFDDQGYFTGWDDATIPGPDGLIFLGHYANNSLSATSKPVLQTNDESSIYYRIYDISSYDISEFAQRSMTFKIGSHLFEKTTKIAQLDSIITIGEKTDSRLLDPYFTEIPVVADGNMKFFSHSASEFGETWLEQTLSLDIKPNQPIFAADYNNDSYEDYFIVEEDTLTILNVWGIIDTIDYTSPITESPLFISENSCLCVPTEEKLFINDKSYDINSAKIVSDGMNIFALTNDKYYEFSFSGTEYEMVATIDLPKSINNSKPVYYHDIQNPINSCCIIQAFDGDIYKIEAESYKKIFSASSYDNSLHTQLALGNLTDQDQIYIVFGIENKIMAIDIFGNYLSGFPITLEKNISIGSFPKIIKLDEKYIIYVNSSSNELLAFDSNGNILPEYSFRNVDYNDFSYFFYEEHTNRLYYIYADISDDNSEALYASHISDIVVDPIVWNGWRNKKYSLYEGKIVIPPIENPFDVYAYPNPAKNDEVRIRVLNASQNIDVKIFDIAGNKIFSQKIGKNPTTSQDIIWNISKISSGMYFGIVKSANDLKKVSIAIEK